MNVNRKSIWYSIDVCTNCLTALTSTQKMYSRATCPYCGHISRGTICDTVRIVIREIKHYKWWYIFNRKKTYEGKDQLSKDWLINNTKL